MAWPVCYTSTRAGSRLWFLWRVTEPLRFLLKTIRPRSLRSRNSSSLDRKESAGAHQVILELPLVFRQISARLSHAPVSAGGLLSGLLLDQMLTCSLKVAQTSLTVQRISGTRMLLLGGRVAAFGLRSLSGRCVVPQVAACCALISCCRAGRSCGGIPDQLSPRAPVLRQFGPFRKYRGDIAALQGLL